MRKFFIPAVDPIPDSVRLDREESHHLARVLRLRAGDEVELLDGRGGRYRGVIEKLGKSADIRVIEKVEQDLGPECPLWVFQGDLKGKKMDDVVQRCTELGVDRFFPFTSDRSQGRPDRERWERRRERWQGLVRSACKQSGRLRVMQVASESTFSELVKTTEAPESALKLLFWEGDAREGGAALDWQMSVSGVCLMLGPEGGFSTAEVELARVYGWRIASLGSRILRAETANLAAVAIIQHRLGVI